MIAVARSSARGSNQRGAVLIQVAVAMLALLALCSFVFDYGVMWSSRRQAQNSADAGALSGALSLAFNSPTDFAAARARAIAVAEANAVWGAAPSVTDPDVTFPDPCPPGIPGPQDRCVKVDVFRNQARGNALPTFFGKLVGVVDQGVQATATAQVLTGNATDCLRPWAVLDRWNEFGAEGPLPLPNSTFDRYSNGQGNNPPQENDDYVAPYQQGSTGFTLPADFGLQFAIKGGPQTQNSSGWFQTLDLPRADNTSLGGATVQQNVLSCNGLPASFQGPNSPACPTTIANDWATTAQWAAQGCYRVQTGNLMSVANEVAVRMNADSGATWQNGGISGSTYDPPLSSPRVVPIGVLDINHYYSQPQVNGSRPVVRLVNIYGFFIEGWGNVHPTTGAITLSNGGQNLIGRLVTVPGTYVATNPNLPAEAAFLNMVRLVR